MSDLADSAARWRRELDNDIAELQRLRDEVRVRLHLAGMELKTRWNEVEPKLAELERNARDAEQSAETLAKIASELVRIYRSVRNQLRE